MSIPLLIGFIGNLIWLVIPFRQVRTSFFFFFLIYGISSAIMLIDSFILIHPAYIYLGQGFFLIVSLYDLGKIPNYKFFFPGVLLTSIILPLVISVGIITIILILQHVIIFFIILKRIIVYSNENDKLNLFHFVLLMFEISAIMRFVVVAGNIRTGIIFFYLTAAFSILIGVFFLYYNVENSPKFSMAGKDIVDTD